MRPVMVPRPEYWIGSSNPEIFRTTVLSAMALRRASPDKVELAAMAAPALAAIAAAITVV